MNSTKMSLVVVLGSLISGAIGGALTTVIMGARRPGESIKRQSKIELVNREAKTTMVLDGEARTLTIFDPEGKTSCITLGPMYQAYALSMRSPESRKGGIALVAGPGQASVCLGTDGEDILGGEGMSRPSKPLSFWGIMTNPDTGQLELGYADPKTHASVYIQKWSMKQR